MTREEEKRMQESIFELRDLPKDKFPHILNMMRYVENLENKLSKKDETIKEAIDYIKTTQYSDVNGLNSYSIMDFWFVKDILQILEKKQIRGEKDVS